MSIPRAPNPDFNQTPVVSTPPTAQLYRRSTSASVFDDLFSISLELRY